MSLAGSPSRRYKSGMEEGRAASYEPNDGAHVVVVEDDEAMAELYRLRLALDGFVVSQVHDGEAELAAIRAQRPDAVVLDCHMTCLDGIGLLQQLCDDESLRAVPVIVLTGDDEPALRDRFLRLGAVAFLVKSQTMPSALCARVHRAVQASAGAAR